MADHSQNTFISNWNATANKLAKHDHFKKLPRLDGGFTGGACTGFSFVLAEYIRNGNPDRFYQLYHLICETKGSDLANAFIYNDKINKLNAKLERLYKNNDKNKKEINLIKNEKIKITRKLQKILPNYKDKDFIELMDFVYKVYILQTKQKQTQLKDEYKDLDDVTKNMYTVLQSNMSSENHRRIGSNITPSKQRIKGELADEILEDQVFQTELQTALRKITNDNESLEIGIHNQQGAHSILAYQANGKYCVFDSNTGTALEASTIEEAAKNIIYVVNQTETQGTNKYTAFDKLWNTSKILTIAIFPISFTLLVYDVLFAKPLPDEILRSEQLNKKTWLTWGKVSAKPDADKLVLDSAYSLRKNLDNDKSSDKPISIDPNVEEISKEDLEVIDRNYIHYKDNRYFGLSWLKSSDATHDIRKELEKEKNPQQRFNKAKQYVNDNPGTAFTKILKENIPALSVKKNRLK